MNTSTRVEFGLYDVTARSDSAPVTEDAKDFCNLSKDLLLESVPNQNKYGTLETRQWLMDGSFLFFPETPRQYFWGFWSTEQSMVFWRWLCSPRTQLITTAPVR